MLWKLAWRNLWRHRTRTVIMSSAVALTYGLMLFGLGVNEDSHARMLREAAVAAGGDVLVHGDEYWATRASDIVIRDGAAALATARTVSGVRAAIPRVVISGLLSTSADSRPVLLEGIEPAAEAALADHAEDLVAGEFLVESGRDPLVLGRRLAERLELELGDRVVLTATGPDGEMTRALFRLTGVIETGTRELDEMIGLTTVAAAQRAVGMQGMLTQIGILTTDDATPEAVSAGLSEAFGPGSALEVLTWADAVPEMVGLVELDDAFGFIYMAIFFAVVLFSITNTFLMAVMERVRDFGLLNALGLRHGNIGRLLLSETVLMTALAMGAGFVLGLAGHLAASRWGISLAGMYDVEDLEIAGIDMSDMVIYSVINPGKWVIGSLLVALATIASALYPAWRATKLAPAEAMRFYE